jgi:predicted nucleic acid-binding Zn ribbon protein
MIPRKPGQARFRGRRRLPSRSARRYLGRVKSYRQRRRNAEPESAASLMSAVVTRLGGTHRAREQRIFAAYTSVAGKILAGQTQPDSVRDTTLFVRVESSALAHQLTLLRSEILGRMAPLLDPGTITDLRTRVAPLRS